MKKIFTVFSFLIFLFSSNVFPQVDASKVDTAMRNVDEKIKIDQKSLKGKAKEQAEISEEKLEKQADDGKKFLIKEINVLNANLLMTVELNEILSKYENKELSFSQIKMIVSEITGLYRKKGHVTSRAYLPKQDIRAGVLNIDVVEGYIGSITFEGNIKVKKSNLLRKSGIYPGKTFQYADIQRALDILNRSQARAVKAILVKGKEIDTTDIVFKVEETNPVSIEMSYDNYGSEYTQSNRGTISISHANITGADDTLVVRHQRAESSLYEMTSVDYSRPISSKTDLNFNALYSESELGLEHKSKHIESETLILGAEIKRKLIDTFDKKINIATAFEYKNSDNSQFENLTSRDELRSLKVSSDGDFSDSKGRTIYTVDIKQGFPKVFGGMKSKDSFASRSGAGARFTKLESNIYRLQMLPLDSYLLWKNQFQYSNHRLVSGEQFSLGGVSNVRAYAPGEYSGDIGAATTFEVNMPLWFLPKKAKTPFSESSYYDAYKWVAFYDWGTVHLNNVLPGERKHETLRGWGFGLRFNMTKNSSFRYDIAWKDGIDANDKENVRHWFSFTLNF